MSTVDMSHHIDLERGCHLRSGTGSDVCSNASVCFTDFDEGSCYSQFYSANAGSYNEYSFACVYDPETGNGSGPRRDSLSSASDCSVEMEVEIETGVPEIKVHLAKAESNCRICHLGLESDSHESGVPMELGCSCKGELGAAHKKCAEAWFKIKGNKTCEICHSVACNVFGSNEIESTENSSEANDATAAAIVAAVSMAETQSFWRGHRFMNFLLACMVFAFVLSWLFHLNVSS